jgi:frataxin-like iron-binding protein CyaY
MTSTTIQNVDWKNGTMTIQFKNGTIYVYKNVPQALYDEFIVAESAGKYFHKYIKPVFIGVKI